MARVDSQIYPLVTNPSATAIIPIVENGKSSRAYVSALAVAANNPQPLIDAAIAAHKLEADPHSVYATDSDLAGVSAAKENAITAGSTAQYWRGDKSFQNLAADVRAVLLTGLSLATASAISATDTILSALGKLQAQVSKKANNALSIRVLTADGVLVAADAGNLVALNSGSPITLTVPQGVFAVGDQVVFNADGVGQVTFAQGANVQINSKSGNKKLSAQYSGATLICRSTGTTDVFWLGGDLTA